MRHYCTLFDSKYLPQGLALYESLNRHSSRDFELNILAMDRKAYEILESLELRDAVILPPTMFQKSPDRTHQEWCWTCASQLSNHLLSVLNIAEITYLDADMMFFSDPEIVFSEIGRRSIAVIPHRFIPEKQYLEVNGQFNVSWVTFKNDRVGRECLSNWAEDCRRKCSAADGCGDQKYLDVWPGKYGKDLCIIQNIGAGLAPWNLANYQLTEGPKVDGVPVVFYHYHEYIHGQRLTNYELRPEDKRLIYEPYIEQINTAHVQLSVPIAAGHIGGDVHGSRQGCDPAG